jgi:hypothetical protein
MWNEEWSMFLCSKVSIHSLQHGSNYIFQQEKEEPCNNILKSFSFWLQTLYVLEFIKGSTAGLADSIILYITFISMVRKHKYCVSYITNPMEQSPWEANIHSATKDITHFSWNLKVHFHVCTNLPLVPIQRNMNPVHSLTPYFSEINVIIIFPCMPRSVNYSRVIKFMTTNIKMCFLLWQCKVWAEKVDRTRSLDSLLQNRKWVLQYVSVTWKYL